MYESYIKLGIVTAIPVFAAIMITLIKKATKGSVPYAISQALIGILFGGIAILGTEWGIQLETAVINCRDAAPLVAGLCFGAPAGIIAGLIGGIERWLAVYWGVGAYTRVACSVSTAIAGIYAAVLRKKMFEDKRPSWAMAFAVGIVMEIFHLSMVFLTHMDDSARAMEVVRICTIPMVSACGISVLLATLFTALVEKDSIKLSQGKPTISQSIQRYLLIAVLLIFAAVSYFSFALQDQMADAQTNTLLSTTIEGLSKDITDASDESLLSLARTVKNELEVNDLETIAKMHDIPEISVANKAGIITDTTNEEYFGFNFNAGEQSQEFLCLLTGTQEYVQGYGPISQNSNVYRKYAAVATDKGFVQVGFDADHFQQGIQDSVILLAKNRQVGENGFVVVFDNYFHVISAPEEFDVTEFKSNVYAVGGFKNLAEEGSIFTVNASGVPMYAQYATTEGYKLVGFMPVDEARQTRNTALYANTYMYILMFAAMFGMIFALVKLLVVNRLNKVKAGLTEITNGNLDVEVDVRGNEEFSILSDNINSTVDTLKTYIDEAAARIDADLAMAKAIQSSALPSADTFATNRKDFNIYARMDTAKEVGGDFYDFYLTQSNILNFLIADVSGKGIPAAMFMMRAKAELKSLTEMGMQVSEAFTRGNSALCEGNDNGMFVTAWQGQINLETGLVKFANAGHNPPVIMHKGGDFEYLKSKVNLVLAGMDGVPYKEQELQLGKGDTIFLYTDGVTEATDANNELYGEDRLLACLNKNKDVPMNELCDKVKEDVDAFVKEAPQFDDITMVALKFAGKPESPSISFDEAKLEDIPVITEWMEEKLEAMGCPMKSVIAINIAVDELYSNIVKYAYGFKPGPASVTLTPLDDPEGVEVRFTDKGIPYNPIKAEDPDTTLEADKREIGGLGIFMVKKSMDEMSYEYKNEENILKIRKNF